MEQKGQQIKQETTICEYQPKNESIEDFLENGLELSKTEIDNFNTLKEILQIKDIEKFHSIFQYPFMDLKETLYTDDYKKHTSQLMSIKNKYDKYYYDIVFQQYQHIHLEINCLEMEIRKKLVESKIGDLTIEQLYEYMRSIDKIVLTLSIGKSMYLWNLSISKFYADNEEKNLMLEGLRQDCITQIKKHMQEIERNKGMAKIRKDCAKLNKDIAYKLSLSEKLSDIEFEGLVRRKDEIQQELINLEHSFNFPVFLEMWNISNLQMKKLIEKHVEQKLRPDDSTNPYS